ncbi:hypothetical protein HAX54_039124, partial [Datura stramonium]|nr:hypothetical protein [Datura stramonium]
KDIPNKSGSSTRRKELGVSSSNLVHNIIDYPKGENILLYLYGGWSNELFIIFFSDAPWEKVDGVVVMSMVLVILDFLDAQFVPSIFDDVVKISSAGVAILVIHHTSVLKDSNLSFKLLRLFIDVSEGFLRPGAKSFARLLDLLMENIWGFPYISSSQED